MKLHSLYFFNIYEYITLVTLRKSTLDLDLCLFFSFVLFCFSFFFLMYPLHGKVDNCPKVFLQNSGNKKMTTPISTLESLKN